MIIVCIVFGGIVALLFFLFLFAYGIHHHAFGKRWDPDGIVKYYDPKEYPNFKTEEVEIPFKKNTLRGFLYAYPNMPYKGILVFAHGMWGSHRAYLQEIEQYAKAGYKVLGFDYKGTELSDGKSIGGLGNSLASLDYALDYIKQIYSKDKIFVVGHSWGGFAAVSIAKYHPDLAGIIAMAPFLNVRRVLKALLPKPLYPLIPFILFIDWVKCGSYSFTNAIQVLRNTKIKTLILHSVDDSMIPYKTSTAYLMKKIKNPNLSYKIVEGKNHNPDYSLEALAYTKEVMTIWNSIKNEEDKLEYKKNMDYHKMGELDQEIISFQLHFLNSL